MRNLSERLGRTLITETTGIGSWACFEHPLPQGLKPVDFIHFIGTNEVVPFYKADAGEFFRTLFQTDPLPGSAGTAEHCGFVRQYILQGSLD